MIKNALKRPILEVLSKTPLPLKEYELHELLDSAVFAEYTQDCSDDLALFRRHFLVMNALYELHMELREVGILLHISALDIHLENLSESSQQELAVDAGFNKLSDYYRNWQNFTQTDDREVDELLNAFWKRYLGYEEHDNALKCLGLEPGVSWSEIRQQYQSLCREHHPDKGGDALRFIQVRQAYVNLKSVYA